MKSGKLSPYINRELSWMDFNARVLEEALKPENPLLERKKFLSIYSSNLDEFYMVRVGSLLDQSLSDHDFSDPITGMSSCDQLSAIYKKTTELDQIYLRAVKTLQDELKQHGIVHMRPKDFSNPDELYDLFVSRVLPVLSPIVLDGKHPFPYIPNKSLFCGVSLLTKGEKHRTAIVMFPENADKLFFLSSDNQVKYVLFEDIVVHYIKKIFTKYKVLKAAMFKVVRNADIILDDEALEDEMDYKQAMIEILRKRRWLTPVRLMTTAKSDSALISDIAKALNLNKEQIFYGYPFLHSGLAWDIIPAAQEKGMNHLMFQKIQRVYPVSLNANQPLFYQIQKKDHLLTHPYERFEVILDLLKQAADDPNVVSIKQTLYRVSKHSAVVRLLADAAEKGKDVTVLLELKARFDEQNNLNYATVLEESGCKVIYGKDNLKVHAKALLITRKSLRGFEYCCHIATGNYNEITAKLYTDVGLLTSNRDIAEDLLNFFNDLSGAETHAYKKLILSPRGIRQAVYGMIDDEIVHAKKGMPAKMIAKFNSLADKGMVDKLIEASLAGVKIKLIIRGICCVGAGLPETKNIQVKSIVGRFLEHSRIFWFQNGGHERMHISSADWMTRNLDRRLEIACPIEDKAIMVQLKHSLNMMLKDHGKGRYMEPDGTYVHRYKRGSHVPNSQMMLYAEARDKARQKQEGISTNVSGYRFRTLISKVLIRLANKISPQKNQ